MEDTKGVFKIRNLKDRKNNGTKQNTSNRRNKNTQKTIN